MISCDTTMDLSVFYTFCGFDPKRLKKKETFFIPCKQNFMITLCIKRLVAKRGLCYIS